MTEILSELQAGYDQRALEAQQAFVSLSEPFTRPKATRTYTGAPLERRRAWAGFWAGIQRQEAAKMYEAERTT